VERAISSRIEDAIYDLEGIKEINSQSSEGVSRVIAEIESGYDRREILNDIKLRVDALNTLPNQAENPVVSLSEFKSGVIQVAVLGEVEQKALRRAADKVRNDLLATPSITLANLDGVTDYEKSIEITPETLDNFNLSLSAVANAIRQDSVDVSAGNIKTRDGDVLVRTDGQAYNASEFAKIPIITNVGANPILLGDIANINDGFEDLPLITRFNGKPAIMIDILRTGEQSSIEIANVVRNYISEHNLRSTNGVTLAFWDDDSKLLKDRLSTLVNSGIYGGILVLLVLSLFLRPAIAFWVFLGVPVSFMGAFIIMPLFGGSFNMVSLFAFITVLGIVVDDAIVTGENIYQKMRDGLDPLDASIVGTKEIAVPVTFGILTTMIAFFPMANLGANRFGYFAAQIPIVVIPVLLFSLIESKLVLPSHLSHVKPRPTDSEMNWLSRVQQNISRGFERSVTRYYQPFLYKCLNNKAITIATLLAVSGITMAWAVNGHLKFTFFPRVASEEIQFSLSMPDTTGFETTQKHLTNIYQEIAQTQEKYRNPKTGESVIRHIYSTTGSLGTTVKSSVGAVRAELTAPEYRHIDIDALQLADEIRTRIGNIPGAEKLSVRAEAGRGGEPINIELSGADLESVRTVGNRLRSRLHEYPNVFDIQDNYSGGKQELNINLKPNAYALGLTLSDIAVQIRASVFGFEAQRIQRGREEVRVMVRLPLEHRSSLNDLLQIPVHVGPNNEPVPLSDLATVTPTNSPTTLYRLNRTAIINVTADVDKDKADVPAIMRNLNSFLKAEVQANPDLKYAFKGEAQERDENNTGLKSGALLVLISIYALLAIPFRSYFQPLIIMSVIPFSMVGAVLGHIIVGYNLSILSIIGMMALLGVVVNDSLVLIDYMNRQRARGMRVFDAVLNSGTARFRPVLLTSITTFAGLTPLLLDSSTQTRFLAPMAVSLGFGILFATAITLIIIPVNYLIAYQSKQAVKRWGYDTWQRWLEFWHREDPGSIA